MTLVELCWGAPRWCLASCWQVYRTLFWWDSRQAPSMHAQGWMARAQGLAAPTGLAPASACMRQVAHGSTGSCELWRLHSGCVAYRGTSDTCSHMPVDLHSVLLTVWPLCCLSVVACLLRMCALVCSPSSSSGDIAGRTMDLATMLLQIVSVRHSRDVCAPMAKQRSNLLAATSAADAAGASETPPLPSSTARRGSATSTGSNTSVVLRSASGGLGISSMTGRRAAQLLHSAVGTTPLEATSSTSSSASSDGSNDVDEASTALLTATAMVTATTDSANGGMQPSSSVTSTPPPQPLLMDKLEQQLALANEWQFDAFALAEASGGHPLSTLAYYLFMKQGLIEHFGLKPAALARFLRRMEAGYKNNPYHNAMHAADVLQTLHCIITRGGLMPGYVDPLHQMACYTAAVSGQITGVAKGRAWEGTRKSVKCKVLLKTEAGEGRALEQGRE